MMHESCKTVVNLNQLLTIIKCITTIEYLDVVWSRSNFLDGKYLLGIHGIKELTLREELYPDNY